MLTPDKVDFSSKLKCKVTWQRSLFSGKGVNSSSRCNSYKYTCTWPRSTWICKVNKEKYKGRDRKQCSNSKKLYIPFHNDRSPRQKISKDPSDLHWM
jgi:hypothetical protein